MELSGDCVETQSEVKIFQENNKNTYKAKHIKAKPKGKTGIILRTEQNVFCLLYSKVT